MSPRLKTVIQYAIVLGITALLVYFSLRGIKAQDISQTWNEVHKGWLIAMAILYLISNVIRAERWRMLLQPVGFQAKLSSSLYSIMVGYLVNLVIPRGGEISRSYNLYKLDKIPVVESFGTVVIERIIDLICLVMLIALSFAFESKKLVGFIQTLPISIPGNSTYVILALILAGLAIIAFLVYQLVIRNERLKNAFKKITNSFKDGILSIFKLKNKGLFILYSFLIWFFYFTMTYAVLKAFPATSTLGFSAVLSLFAIGAIAMAAPLPGGMGSYHVLVPQGLFFLYQIPLDDAVVFTVIFHGWQTALFIIFGALSLVVTSYIVKRHASKDRRAN